MNEAELDELAELFGFDDSLYTEPDDTPDKINIFDLINDIGEHGNFIESYFETNRSMPKEYMPYMINRAFSNFPDTVLIANEMNKNWKIPNEMHWRFLKNVIGKRRRRSKWYKNLENLEPIELMASYFHCTLNEMRKNINALTKEEQHEILEKIDPEHYQKKKRGQSGNKRKL